MSHYINNNGISKLFISPRVRHRNPERVGVAHQPRAFPGRESARIFARALIHENFRSVLVVARRQGARHVCRFDQAKAEAVALGAVLRGVVLQIQPEVVGEGVFVLHFLFLVVEESSFVPLQDRFAAVGTVQDVFECVRTLGWQRQRVEIECDRLAEADDENAFAVLRNEVRAIYDAAMDVVAEVVGQGTADNVEGAAFVVRDEVLDVLQQEGARALCLDDARHVEEQRALCFAGEAVLLAQRIFLRHAGNRKGLAGKPGQQHVVVGNVGSIYLGDVSGDGMPVAEIFGVGFLRVAVPFAGVHAAPADLLERIAQPADAREQIDEIKRACGAFFPERQELLQSVREVGGRIGLPRFPAADGADTHAQMLGNGCLCVVFAGFSEIGQYGILVAD